jgi:hypothetical protein
MEMGRFVFILLSLLMLQACSQFVAEADNTDKNSRYFADASECYETAHKKEKVNVMLSGNKEHSFAFPITIDIPITYDAGVFKNCMMYACHSEPKVDADPTAYLELSRRCLDQARGEENSNDVYANCIKNGDISVDVIDSRKSSPKTK